MNKIEIYEHCFGPGVTIDGQSLFKHEYDERSDEEVRDLKLKLIQELINNVDQLDISQLRDIAGIVCNVVEGWQFVPEESYSDTCDQCGNYNWSEVCKRVGT